MVSIWRRLTLYKMDPRFGYVNLFPTQRSEVSEAPFVLHSLRTWDASSPHFHFASSQFLLLLEDGHSPQLTSYN